MLSQIRCRGRRELVASWPWWSERRSPTLDTGESVSIRSSDTVCRGMDPVRVGLVGRRAWREVTVTINTARETPNGCVIKCRPT